jgi:hypothetical protein
MAVFDERERAFEARFQHDQELQFKVKVRRNRLLGLWAAERMGLDAAAAEAYAGEVVDSEFAGGDRHVVEKVRSDLNARGFNYTPAQIEFEMSHLAETARQQIMRE